MLSKDEIYAALRPLASDSNLLKLSDVVVTLGLRRQDCIVALDELTNNGALIRTCDSEGELYYWFVGANNEPAHCGDSALAE